jgi:hypothetical protein
VWERQGSYFLALSALCGFEGLVFVGFGLESFWHLVEFFLVASFGLGCWVFLVLTLVGCFLLYTAIVLRATLCILLIKKIKYLS